MVSSSEAQGCGLALPCECAQWGTLCGLRTGSRPPRGTDRAPRPTGGVHRWGGVCPICPGLHPPWTPGYAHRICKAGFTLACCLKMKQTDAGCRKPLRVLPQPVLPRPELVGAVVPRVRELWQREACLRKKHTLSSCLFSGGELKILCWFGFSYRVWELLCPDTLLNVPVMRHIMTWVWNSCADTSVTLFRRKTMKHPWFLKLLWQMKRGVKHTFKNLVPSVLTGQTLQGVDFRGFSGKRSYRWFWNAVVTDENINKFPLVFWRWWVNLG